MKGERGRGDEGARGREGEKAPRHVATSPRRSLAPSLLTRVRHILAAVRIQESVFALPFAYLGMLLAAGGMPSARAVFWVTLAMVGARNAGMAFNRVLDREMDALNPRTANRHLPRGILQPWELTALGLVALALFLLAAAQLNPLALLLSPIAALFVVGYSLLKRFTWLTNVALGLTLGMAPAGGWVAVTGTLSWEALLLMGIVACFATGFDIFNTCQDVAFDREHRVHSLPARFGLDAAFTAARALHALMVVGLLVLGVALGLTWPYYVACAVAAGLLIYQHRVLSPGDLSAFPRIFVRVNGLISVTLLAGTLLAVLGRE